MQRGDISCRLLTVLLEDEFERNVNKQPKRQFVVLNRAHLSLKVSHLKYLT